MWQTFAPKIWKIWLEGGLTMFPLLAVSLLLYGLCAQLLAYFRRLPYKRLPEPVWARWIEKPELGQGAVGEIIRYAQDEVRSLDDVSNRFGEIVSAEIRPIDRRLTVINVLIASAPLLGLLGTVFGMLVTFRAISIGGGKMGEMVAKGISEALITTEMGLLIAIPGLLFAYLIRQKRQEYEAFLARLESVTIQHLKKKLVQ